MNAFRALAAVIALVVTGGLVSAIVSPPAPATETLDLAGAARPTVAGTAMQHVIGDVVQVDFPQYDGPDLPVTVERILIMLERAERVARGRSPELPTATNEQAAHLTMLFASHLSGEGASLAELTTAAMELAMLFDPDTAPTTSFTAYIAPFEFAASDDPAAPQLPMPTLPEVATPYTDMLRAMIRTWQTSMNGLVNGQLPDHVLCPLPWASSQRLRCDAAAALTSLNDAYRARWGSNLPISDAYRTFEGQVRSRLTFHQWAAIPGHSMHGWGLAVDFGRPLNTGHGDEYQWLLANAPTFGWDNPPWARPGGALPEPWHWEFVAAGPVDIPPTAAQVAYWQGIQSSIDADAEFRAAQAEYERALAEWEANERAAQEAWEREQAAAEQAEREAGDPVQEPAPNQDFGE